MEEGEPFQIQCRTISVQPSKNLNVFRIHVKVKAYQNPEDLGEEPAGEDLFGGDSGGEEEEQPNNSDKDEEQSTSDAETRGNEKKRKSKGGSRSSKKRKGPKMLKAEAGDDEYVLIGPLCSIVTSPLFQLTLAVSPIPREHNTYKLESVIKAEIKGDISVKRIIEALKKTKFYNYGSADQNEKRNIAKSIKMAFSGLANDNGVEAKTTLTARHEKSLKHCITDGRLIHAINNIFKPSHFFHVANSLGPEAASLMSNEELEALSRAAMEKQEMNFALLYEKLCFKAEFTDATTEVFMELADIPQDNGENSVYTRIMSLFSASEIYHEMVRHVEVFNDACLFEPDDKRVKKMEGVEGSKWSDSAVKILLGMKDRFFIHQDALTGRKIIQPASIKRDFQSLAEKLLEVESIKMFCFDIDDNISRLTDKESTESAYFDHIYNTCRSERDNTVAVANTSGRINSLQRLTLLNFVMADRMTNNSSSSSKKFTTLVLDRAHLFSVQEVLDIFKKAGPGIKKLYLYGHTDYYPNSPGSWFRDLWGSKVQNKTTEYFRGDLMSQEKINGFYEDIAEYMSKPDTKKTCDIFVSNASRKREINEILEQIHSALGTSITGCKVKTAFEVDCCGSQGHHTVIVLDELKRTSLLKCLSCTRMGKKIISFIGNESQLGSIYRSHPNARMSNFGFFLGKAFANSLDSGDPMDYAFPQIEEDKEPPSNAAELPESDGEYEFHEEEDVDADADDVPNEQTIVHHIECETLEDTEKMFKDEFEDFEDDR